MFLTWKEGEITMPIEEGKKRRMRMWFVKGARFAGENLKRNNPFGIGLENWTNFKNCSLTSFSFSPVTAV
jgi:hypothetical protein